MLTGTCSCRNPLDSPHSAHLHLPWAAQETLWHSYHLLIALWPAALKPPLLPTPTVTLLFIKGKKGRKTHTVWYGLCMLSLSFSSTSTLQLVVKLFFFLFGAPTSSKELILFWLSINTNDMILVRYDLIKKVCNVLLEWQMIKLIDIHDHFSYRWVRDCNNWVNNCCLNKSFSNLWLLSYYTKTCLGFIEL